MNIRQLVKLWLLVSLSGVLAGSWGCKVKLDEDHLIEKPLGALAEWGVELQYPLVKDPLLMDFVGAIGQAEVAVARRKHVPYRFKIVDTGEVNAFAIPWGGIYLTTGLLNFADTEDELACVIGHEIGHVEGRHAVRAFKTQLWATAIFSLLKGRVSRDLLSGLQLAGFFYTLHHSRKQEYDADRRGVEITYRSYYDPSGAVTFFEKLQERYGDQGRFWTYFSTHPLTRDRISRAKQQPELSPNSARALTHIARGYEQRSMYRLAAEHYQEAVAADGRYVPAYLGLGRVAATRGEMEQAREYYQTALRYERGNAEAQEALARLRVITPASTTVVRRETPSVSPTVAQQRGEASLKEIRGMQQSFAAQARSSRPRSDRDLLERAQEQLSLLYASELRDPDWEQLIAAGNQALIRLQTAWHTLEQAQEEGARTLGLLQEVQERLLAHLRRTPKPEVAALVLESSKAVRLAAARVEEALRRGEETRRRLERVERLTYEALEDLYEAQRQQPPDVPFRTSSSLRYLVETAKEQTTETLNEVKEIAKRTAGGQSIALQMSINSYLAGATPAQERIGASLIAHFLRTEAEEILAWRKRGHRYGEIALLLGGARSARRTPEQLVGRHPLRTRLVSHLEAAQVPLENVNLVLKLLNQALATEFGEEAK